MDAIDKLLKVWRKKALPAERLRSLDFGPTEIEYLLPHRSPFLLLDRLVGISDEPLIVGQRYIDPQDPILAGHFPNFPVYPGVMQLEMLGQLALCLHYFQNFPTQESIKAPSEQQELNIRASKVLGAHYLHPVLPNKTVELRACELGQSDGLTARMLGQVLLDGQVATVCAQEVCFLD